MAKRISCGLRLSLKWLRWIFPQKSALRNASRLKKQDQSKRNRRHVTRETKLPERMNKTAAIWYLPKTTSGQRGQSLNTSRSRWRSQHPKNQPPQRRRRGVG